MAVLLPSRHVPCLYPKRFPPVARALRSAWPQHIGGILVAIGGQRKVGICC